ncbi:inositol monophosphatase family protein [Actinocrispum wychmicini]|uniref:inositol monophosphatase family protein n=1 Tax=Actinocrispum wychmicini TaxID=1213861 RepID=UPI001A9F3A6D|nr:inositol monophosphatase family protein [Actinocrispum wychmicini]
MDRSLLDFAVDLTLRAGRLAAERFMNGVGPVSVKQDGSEVTEVDLMVEDLMRTALATYAPDDEIYGEEAGTSTGSSGRRWVIDPIDGTTYFARRVPLFQNVLAFEDEHGPAVSVINRPMSNELIYAGRGHGCWQLLAGNETRRQVRVGSRRTLGGAGTQTGNPATWSDELLLALHRKVFLMGYTGGVTDLVTDRVDAVVVAGFPMGYEDLAPLPVLVEEAGGKVTDLSGGPVLTGDGTVLATNESLHGAFLDVVRDLPRSRDWRALQEH